LDLATFLPHITLQTIFDLGFAGLGLICVFFIAIFLVSILIAIWVYRDAEKRGMSGVLWLIVVLIAGVIGLIIYLVVRSDHPVRPAGAYPAAPAYGLPPQYAPGYYPPPGTVPAAPPPQAPAAGAPAVGMTCRTCGTVSAVGVQYCRNCGAKL